MSKRALPHRCSILFMLVPSGLAGDDEETVGLIGNMRAMQTFSHQRALAIDAGHLPLADFYAHELEETIDAASDIAEYDGQPIGPLVDSMFWPVFEQLEDGLEQEPAVASTRFDALINSCNACQLAIGFGLIRIQRSAQNPFMQYFSPRP